MRTAAQSFTRAWTAFPRPLAPGSVCCLPENASGNFVKVVQRVPVKLVITDKLDAEHTLAAGNVRRSDGVDGERQELRPAMEVKLDAACACRRDSSRQSAGSSRSR